MRLNKPFAILIERYRNWSAKVMSIATMIVFSLSASVAWAVSFGDFSDYMDLPSTATDIETAAERGTKMVVGALCAIAVAFGVFLLISAGMAYARKREDPQSAHGWVAKAIVGLLFTVAGGYVLAIIATSIKKSASGGFGFGF